MNRFLKLSLIFVLVILVISITLKVSNVYSSNILEMGPSMSEGVIDIEYEIPDPTKAVNLQAELQADIDRWAGEDLAGPGWLHLVILHETDNQQTSTLPNGQKIPADYIMEKWYFQNEVGLVIKVVAQMSDLEGHVIQISTFNDGIWHNLTIGEKWTGEPFSVQLDFGLSKDMAIDAKTNMSINHYAGEYKNTPVEIYSIDDQFDVPISMEGYSYKIIGGARRAYFDSDTGDFLVFERSLTAEDGTINVVESVRYLTVEKTDILPDSFQELLEKE